MPAQEFDSHSQTYHDTLDQLTRITGEVGEYFAELKARYLRAKMISTTARRR
jgi:hypothetical protein